MPFRALAVLLSTLLILSACSSSGPGPIPPENADKADVTAVRVSGTEGNYTFEVTVSSPDEGCDEYADWWEVVTRDGTLIYRAVFDQPHIDEQPFTTSGGPVQIPEDQQVVVRAHMKEAGYGGQALEGAPGAPTFDPADLPDGFATDIDDIDPQPGTCQEP